MSDRNRLFDLPPPLLAGFALRPLPAPLLSPFLDLAMTAMRRRHPEVFERLEALGEVAFLIDPVDLPFAFLLRLNGHAPRLRPVGEGEDPGPTAAAIRGPLRVLIDLLQGRLDGDAAFFSRDLAVEGDTEAIVTLRNAVDNGEIDVIEDLLSLLGPFDRPARRALDAAGTLFARAAQDIDAVRAAIVEPVTRRADMQAAELRRLEETVADLRRKLAKTARPARRMQPDRVDAS